MPDAAKGPGSGIVYADGKLIVPDELASAVRNADKTTFVEPVPATVTALQMRRAIRAANLGQSVTAYIGAASAEVVEAWDYATEIARAEPLWSAMFEAICGSAAAADTLFRAAGAQAMR